MNLWWRLLGLFLASGLQPRIDAPFGVSRLALRVWPGDLDTSLHMNNGRYWTLMDLGRTDLMLRSGLWRSVVRERWVPVLTTGAIRFRRELRLFQRVELQTRIVGWDETHFMVRHDLVTRDGVLAARALVRAGLYDRRRRSFVSTKAVLRVADVATAAPPVTPETQLMRDVERVIRLAG